MDNFNKVEIAMSMRGKKLLFIIGAPDNRVDFIYTGRFKMTRKWKETFDPLAELQKIVRHVYVEGSDDHGSNIPGLLIRGEEDLPDLWESDFSLLGLVGIYDGGGPFEWEGVEDIEPGEPYRLSRLTSTPSGNTTLALSVPVISSILKHVSERPGEDA